MIRGFHQTIDGCDGGEDGGGTRIRDGGGAARAGGRLVGFLNVYKAWSTVKGEGER